KRATGSSSSRSATNRRRPGTPGRRASGPTHRLRAARSSPSPWKSISGRRSAWCCRCSRAPSAPRQTARITVAETETPAEPSRKYKKPPRRRVKTPTILQMEAVECGAAALAMVLAYYGRWVPLEELRQECGVSRDGSKASNVLRAARKYGLEAKGFKYSDLEKLYELEFPAILFWNFNHFVVLDGFRGEQVLLNDPAQGPRVVSMAELDGSYSGVVLTFKPGPEFRKGGASPKMLPALRRRLTGSESALLYTILCGLLLVIPGLVIPTFTRVFIDDYLLAGQAWLVWPLLWAMAATLVVHGLLTWMQKHALLRLETKLALVTSSQFFM